MPWARLHRWLAIALVVPLVVWSVTGLLFHWKPGWDRAYDVLSADRGAALPAELRAVPPAALAAGATRVELFDTALGPLWRATTPAGAALFDARTGAARPPLTGAEARALAEDAVARSAHRAAYGAVRAVEVGERAVRVAFAAGPVVTVGRTDARLAQRGPDTDRIDGLYKLHYLQWTGHAALDRALALVGLAWIWAVLLPGVVLFVRAVRRRRPAVDPA